MFKLIRKYIIFYFIYNRGITKESIGEYHDALDDFYLALSLNPNSIKTYKAIARMSRRLKEHLNGIDFLNKASRRFPFLAELYEIKAELYRSIKDYENALKEYDFAVKNDGSNWEYYKNRAEVKILAGLNKEALNDYNSAVNLNSCSHKLYSERGFYLFEMKDYAAAAADFKKAAELNPNKKHYRCMLESMRQLMRNSDTDPETSSG